MPGSFLWIGRRERIERDQVQFRSQQRNPPQQKTEPSSSDCLATQSSPLVSRQGRLEQNSAQKSSPSSTGKMMGAHRERSANVQAGCSPESFRGYNSCSAGFASLRVIRGKENCLRPAVRLAAAPAPPSWPSPDLPDDAILRDADAFQIVADAGLREDGGVRKVEDRIQKPEVRIQGTGAELR